MKKLIALIAAVLMIVSVLTACGENPAENSAADDGASKESIFKMIEGKAGWSLYAICYCKDTKVMYSISDSGVLTLLVNPDGSPMIYQDDK